ncbi:TetR/AcrR family transcriptional regulator [Streptomyces sp. NPDC020800]|uniref:TetR/AcrR family transcriptional regulator n=1 Tax=Streptomyces sp. NPDC020800 TaxID=3365092 RepID=UPI00378F7C56
MTQRPLMSADEVRLTAKGRATRARIVQAAAALMFERGVAGTSTEDVRESAGVSNSQLYHYFNDKNQLVRAVIVHQTQQVLDAQQPLLGRLDSFGALEAWRDLLIDLQQQRACRGGCPIGSLAGELADADEEARELLVTAFARWESAIRDGLASMRGRGELRPDADPDQLALVTLTALQGGLLLTETRRDVTPLRAGLNAAIAYIRSYAVQDTSRTCARSPAEH